MKGRLIVNLCTMAIIVAAISLSGCAGTSGGSRSAATKIPITIYKSAAIDIRSKNIEKIAVAPFSSKFTGKDDPGMKTAEMFAKALVDTLIYTVKGPNEVNSDLLVNGLGVKPFMEKSELQKVGRALKVDAFFIGEVKKREIISKRFTKVLTEEEETGEGEFVKNEEGKLVYQSETKEVDIDLECRSGIGAVTIRYKLYNAKTGNLIFDRVESLSEEVDAFCFRVGLNPEEMTKEQINDLLNEVTQELNERFVAQLTPPSRTELVVFERIPTTDKFSNNLLTIGIDYAKVGDWPKAIDHLKQCKDKNRDSSEAHYNLGVAYEGYGWLEKALTEFQIAQKKNPKKLYSKAIRDVKRAISITREGEK